MLNLIRRSNTSSFFYLASKITRFKHPHSPHTSLLSPRRSYYIFRPQPLRYRGHQIPPWHENPRFVLILLLAGGGAALTLCYGSIETVPYTNRSRFVLLSPSLERWLGEAKFKEFKFSLRRKILPPCHPDSIRLGLISDQIIEAAQRRFRPEDRQWDMGKAWGSQAATRHLEGLNWEVVVVRNEKVNAMCLPGGKIVVFTGLLEHFKNDAEIATVIGHEVVLLNFE